MASTYGWVSYPDFFGYVAKRYSDHSAAIELRRKGHCIERRPANFEDGTVQWKMLAASGMDFREHTEDEFREPSFHALG